MENAIVKQGSGKDDFLLKIGAIQDNYTQSTKGLITYLQEHNLSFDAIGIERYTEYLREKYNSANSLNFHLSALRSRIRHAFNHSDDRLDLLKVYKLEDFLKTKVKKTKINNPGFDKDKILSIDEIKEFIDKTPKHLSLLTRLLFHTGIRISEALSIELDSIKRVNGYYEIRILGKGEKERIVKIVSLNLIKEIKSYYRGTTYLFEKKGKMLNRISITNLMSYYGEKILDKHLTSHLWRHCFSCYYLENNPSKLKALSTYIGHSNVNLTIKYYLHQSVENGDLSFLKKI